MISMVIHDMDFRTVELTVKQQIVVEAICASQAIHFSLSKRRKGVQFLQVIADVNHSHI